MSNAPALITDPETIASVQEFIWRTDTRQAARDAGVAPEDVERMTFWAWRLRRAGVDPEQIGKRAGEPNG